MCNQCLLNRRPMLSTMSQPKLTQCHHNQWPYRNMPTAIKSITHISHTHSCNGIQISSDFISQSNQSKSIICRAHEHWQFATKFFNRKCFYRYLLTLFILMYTINNSPILLTNAQMLKSQSAITQNFNNNIILNSDTSSSSVTPKPLPRSSRNNNNHFHKEQLNDHPDIEVSEHSSCQTCKHRKEMEESNLISFKNHILERLQLKQLPNISIDAVSSVSESVLTKFYNKYGDRYIRRSGLNNKNDDSYDEMMGDEPKMDKNNINRDDEEAEEDEDEAFFSSTQSIIAFPNVSKARHRGDILEFSIQHSSNLAISEAIFHLYIHGEDWLAINNPSLLEDDIQDTISISLNRLVRSTLQRYTRTDSDYKGPIPKGDGVVIQFNVTEMVLEWIRHDTTPQEIVIKTTKQWMRQLIMFDSNSQNSPYIEIQTKEIRHSRAKRNLDCQNVEGETRCCRYPLRVDFRKFGWDWILAPDVYDAYYCSGDCPQGYLPRYHHSYISQLGSSSSPCCSPKKLSAISLLYYDTEKQIIHSIIPNMAVDKCSCS